MKGGGIESKSMWDFPLLYEVYHEVKYTIFGVFLPGVLEGGLKMVLLIAVCSFVYKYPVYTIKIVSLFLVVFFFITGQIELLKIIFIGFYVLWCLYLLYWFSKRYHGVVYEFLYIKQIKCELRKQLNMWQHDRGCELRYYIKRYGFEYEDWLYFLRVLFICVLVFIFLVGYGIVIREDTGYQMTAEMSFLGKLIIFITCAPLVFFILIASCGCEFVVYKGFFRFCRTMLFFLTIFFLLCLFFLWILFQQFIWSYGLEPELTLVMFRHISTPFGVTFQRWPALGDRIQYLFWYVQQKGHNIGNPWFDKYYIERFAPEYVFHLCDSSVLDIYAELTMAERPRAVWERPVYHTRRSLIYCGFLGSILFFKTMLLPGTIFFGGFLGCYKLGNSLVKNYIDSVYDRMQRTINFYYYLKSPMFVDDLGFLCGSFAYRFMEFIDLLNRGGGLFELIQISYWMWYDLYFRWYPEREGWDHIHLQEKYPISKYPPRCMHPDLLAESYWISGTNFFKDMKDIGRYPANDPEMFRGMSIRPMHELLDLINRKKRYCLNYKEEEAYEKWANTPLYPINYPTMSAAEKKAINDKIFKDFTEPKLEKFVAEQLALDKHDFLVKDRADQIKRRQLREKFMDSLIESEKVYNRRKRVKNALRTREKYDL